MSKVTFQFSDRHQADKAYDAIKKEVGGTSESGIHQYSCSDKITLDINKSSEVEKVRNHLVGFGGKEE